MSFDAETIMAYVDGETDAITARRIEQAMAVDTALASAIERQRSLKNRLVARFDPVLEEELPDRLTSLLTTVDTSLAERRAIRERPRWQLSAVQWGAMAASLVLGLYLGQASLGGSGAVIAEQDGALVAQGELGRALDTQLAASQPADAAARIGLTFRDRQGAICRSFDTSAVSGIACRDEGHWQLRQAISGGNKIAEYRQVGSSAIMQAAAEMMNGDAFDAKAEAAALAKGWR